ncbi:winged helix-turn-helix transcriptional regulator [Mycoplasmatota bacterium]|nr:winged helix-turn-helix transcriptional regulator [Mycoplasmatota bacterium]
MWKQEFICDDNTINVHISNNRSKGKFRPLDKYIQTVWGIGYKMQE